MRAADLNLSDECIGYIEGYGAKELYEPQAAAVEAGLLDGHSMLVSAPTASGKSLIAAMAVMAMLEGGGRKAVYLSPLRALVAEKYKEFRGMRGIPSSNPLKPASSTADLNVRDRLSGNLLCMTNERMDLALRKDEDWVREADLVIADEIHLIGDPHRGPALEMVLARLNDGNRQVVGLSATISNAEEMAKWLKCRLVRSSWRPVRLTEGVCDGRNVSMADGTEYTIRSSSRGAAVELALDSVAGGGQALIFVNTRRGAPSQAKKAAASIRSGLGDAQKKKLGIISRAILREGGGTGLADELSGLVAKGVGFHHAGLNAASRRRVEDGFREGHIKVLAATPTLAAGVNLPARRVVISSLVRYDGRAGRSVPISVMEYKQFCGRAGRPQYDDVGDAVSVAASNPREAMDRYVLGQPEAVESALHNRLAVHVLSLVVAEPGIPVRSIRKFFDGTLGGVQWGGMDVDGPLRTLRDYKMVETEGKRYAATKLGEMVNELYLEPQTASEMLETIENAGSDEYAAGKRHTLTFLHEAISCAEFGPVLRQRKAERAEARDLVERYRSHTIWHIDPYDVSRNLLGICGWIEEESERDIADKYGMDPGDVHRTVQSTRWLLQSMIRIAKYARLPDVERELDTLRVRVVNGVREELQELVGIRNVGRVRGRALYRAGIRTRRDVRATPLDRIQKICKVGPRKAKTIRMGR